MLNVDWVGSAIRGTIPTIVFLSLLFFRKGPTGRGHTRRRDWNSEALYRRFRPLYWKFAAGILLTMIIFAVTAWFCLSQLNHWIAALDESQAIHLLPQTALWCIFPVFGALVCSLEITLQVMALLIGRETVDLFMNWQNNNTRGTIRSRYQGIDSRKILRWMMVGLALPAGLATVLALPMHANIGPEKIRDCGYAFRPCATYPLQDAVRITEISGFRARSGKLIHRAGLVLDFNDGRRWSSAEWGNWQSSVDPELKAFLLGKTTLRLNHAVTAEEIPSLPSGNKAP